MDKEFIYLMPGNWFELKNINKDKIQPYDLNMLKSEILQQINSRAEKLDFINSFLNYDNQNATVENITFNLDKDRFNKIAKVLSKETRHPIITFHGTKPDAVESIFKHGYIIPGDNGMPTMVKKAHGAAYGTGIYSSPFFNKANYYATPDANGYIYIIVNILFPGKAILIPPLHTPNIQKGRPTQGFYPDGTNTRIVYGLEQIISADPDRIIPIAVMKIKIYNK